MSDRHPKWVPVEAGTVIPAGQRYLTERQVTAWRQDVAPICRAHDLPESFASWNAHFADESRPGRGHYLNATFTDGEHFAQVLMDVYGYPTVSVAELDWVHADSDEELECDVCSPGIEAAR